MANNYSDFAGLDKKTYIKQNKKGLAHGSEYFSQALSEKTGEAQRMFKFVQNGTKGEKLVDGVKSSGKFMVKGAGKAVKGVTKDSAHTSHRAFKTYVKNVSADTFGDSGGGALIDGANKAEDKVKKVHQKHKAKKIKKQKKAQKVSKKIMDKEYKKALANGDFKKFEEKFKSVDKRFNVSKVTKKHGPVDSHKAYKAFQKKAMQKKFSRRIYKQHKRERLQKMGKKAGNIISSTASFIKNVAMQIISKPHVMIGIAITFAVILTFQTLMMIISSFAGAGNTAAVGTTYLAEDDEIYACEEYYSGKETELKNWIKDIETNYPGYDEYDYSDIATISHNPYVLATYLNSYNHTKFTCDDVKTQMDSFFESQYNWYTTEETVTREVTEYDTHGNPYQTTVEVTILHVHVVNNGEIATAYGNLTADQASAFSAQLNFKGNKSYLWEGYDLDADEIADMNVGSKDTYHVPKNLTRDDAAFAALVEVGDSLMGTPYLWGGKSPEDGGLDCSGFVCYCYNQSGYASIPTMCAQDIYKHCEKLTYDEVMPGDLVFLTQTCESSKTITHVAIYVGNGMVMNCGDPIKYCNINTSWWKSHFYAYGRYTG